MGSNPGETNGVARRPLSVVIVWVLAACCVFLGASNLLTLLSDRVHTMAYGGIRAVVSAVVAEAALSRILSASPMVKRDRQVDVATEGCDHRVKSGA